MCDKDMVDLEQFGDGEIADSGARVHQHVIVEQHGGRAQISADATAATEYPDLHGYLDSNFQEPSQPSSGGFTRKCATRSRNSL